MRRLISRAYSGPPRPRSFFLKYAENAGRASVAKLSPHFRLCPSPESGEIGTALPRMRNFKVDQLQTFIFPGREEMGAAAAEAAAGAINAALAARGSARVILASAPSQIELLCYLRESEVDWSRVTLFHMDEYIGINADHMASFRHFHHNEVLAHIKPKA